MYHIKNDQRAIRSSQRLYEALASLMRERPFNTITVSDLAEAAQVGRTTFYRNFDEIEDILRMRCDQTFDELMQTFKAYRQPHKNETEIALLKPLLRFFYLHSEIIELLLIANRIDIIQDSFRFGMEPFKAAIATHHGVSAEYVDYSIAMRTGITTNILIHWIETGKQQAPDELANTVGSMIRKMATLDQLL